MNGRVRVVAAKTSSSRSCSYREVILVKKLRSTTNPRSISMISLIKPSFYQWNSSNSLNCCFLRPCNMACRQWSKSIMLKPLKKKKVPLFVMMPIDTFGIDTSGVPRIRRIKALTMSLKALKLAGVQGIAVEIGHLNGDIYYQDQNGFSNDDYLTLGVDHVPLFCGWTALQCYEDFMFSFVTKFESLLGSIIKEMSIGLGPAGELRYPAHPFDDGRWRFPGVGEFQCHDKYMLEDLKMAACQVGKPEWGNKGPQNAGYYNSIPSEVPFFEDGEESFLSDYGHFFLEWYSGKLICHADVILAKAANILKKYQGDRSVLLVVKIGGIHWWYQTDSLAAELTAGYYNTSLRDCYDPLASVLSRYGAALHVSCQPPLLIYMMSQEGV